MVYAWILSQLNNSYSQLSGSLILYLFDFLIPRMLEIVLTPFVHPEIFWIILPLIAATMLVIFYFGRYRNEELGFSSAFSNNIALMFVGINLMQQLSSNNLLLTNKALFIYAIIVYNLVQLVLNYFHLMPKKISFVINSAVPVNVITYLAILIVYSNIAVDFSTIIASIMLILIFYGVSKIIWIFVPLSRGSKILRGLQEKKALKLKMKEELISRRNENLSLNEKGLVIFGAALYLIIYLALFLINKFWFNLSEYYLLIFSAYFITYSFFYMKIKRLSLANLLFNLVPTRRDRGVLIGLLVFFYYMIFSSLAVSAFKIPEYEANNLTLIISILAVSVSSEIFFRGVIQRGLKIRFNKDVSIAIQALLWALLKGDVFLASFATIPYALMGLIIAYPVGLLLGYVKEEWYLDSSISASLTFGILSIILLLL